MRPRRSYPLAAIAFALAAGAGPARAQETARAVEGGGIMVPGWMGTVDASEARRGMTVDQAKLSKDGDAPPSPSPSI